MKSRFVNKINHLMLCKIKNKITLSLISKMNKIGKLNPMFGKIIENIKQKKIFFCDFLI